ncbi:putative metal-dependent HD superfamily phosphohydrolase [Deinobacterium chartae]|uniref:Putative metal-dependent HD superfamily phosphohydrolase n=1 Tax=Deinobacterium chartae TaxID=521158 RepID=A0A841HVB2_9DEIO|nr:HD domain-containing protein [Deinobacterium chartae]MBB6097317.1 putative metal-dependent HD superfamily phosphohydrolase [Deinobacterium chartae]
MDPFSVTDRERTRLAEDLLDLLAREGVPPGAASALHTRLEAAYREPGRAYHTLGHLRDLLRFVDERAARATDPDLLRLAAWFHDAVYDPRRNDNELKSAELARSELLLAGLSRGRAERVAGLVLATRDHRAEDADAGLLLDADLAVLAAPRALYEAYARAVRREYGFVPAPLFRRGRRKILEGLLARPRIYHIVPELEEPARANLTRELAALR